MATHAILKPWSLVVPGEMMRELTRHLFPGDGDEHGAVIVAGISSTPRGTRLLARELFLAQDGEDYVPGTRGYRKLTASFIRDRIRHCRDEKLAYLAVHCHGGTDSVAFSGTDMTSHERGYPALLDIANGQPVGALVIARNAVAGDIWLTDGTRVSLSYTRVLDTPVRTLLPEPLPSPRYADPEYDRHTRLFGDRGQDILRTLKVGVIGAGGAGSLIIQDLSRLGIGHLVFADPERIEVTNLPRVVGSTRRDALAWFCHEDRPRWLRLLAKRLAAPKVRIAARGAHQANPGGTVEAIFGDITDSAVADRFLDCDYLFLAADSMQARLVFNSLVHQHLIPGAQVGAKVQADKTTGQILDIFAVYRPVTPDHGCLWCNGLINSVRLQEEAISPQERLVQRYVDDSNVAAPSVITLNAIASAHATNDFLFTMTGLVNPAASDDYLRFLPRERGMRFDEPRKDTHCLECGSGGQSRRARGDQHALPTRAHRPAA